MPHAVGIRLLVHDPFLWRWEIEDASGLCVESSWEDHWETFGSPEEARSAPTDLITLLVSALFRAARDIVIEGKVIPRKKSSL